MRKGRKDAELKLPYFRGPASQPGSPELGMDDYYRAVVMLHQVMPCCQKETSRIISERFVIREEGEPFISKPPKA